jgi:lipopolysaccharide/colanic/teichoic acid biosynthesis glycosyltransferase
MDTNNERIAFISNNADIILNFSQTFKHHYQIFNFDNIYDFVQWTNKNEPVKLIVTHTDLNDINGITLRRNCKNIAHTANVPFVILVERLSDQVKNVALREQFADIYEHPADINDFITRADYLIKNPPRYHKSIFEDQHDFPKYYMPISKRLFDILVSLSALIVLLPVFLIVSIIIRLESKGPVFYYSKRVGTGYQMFKFYKFRSMRQGADAMLKDLQHLNQYSAKVSKESNREFMKSYKCESCIANNTECQNLMYMDGDKVCEKIVAETRKQATRATFTKIENDPRITKFGKIIRNTSIDELPQLFNVLKGDMSIVGNRPLPLYEAEKITTDQFALRFLAPAGITGLWQVTMRGKGGSMSEEERMELDNDYAKDYSFGRDIKLILKTIPALFQKENV